MFITMIDSHCHLAAKEFFVDIEKVLDEAIKAGVKACLVCAENAGDFDRILELSDRHLELLPCFGVHPVQEVLTDDGSFKQRCVTLQDLHEALPLMRQHVDRLYAVGEIGLDFTPFNAPTHEHRDLQRQIFREQIDFAQKHYLPLSCHSRSAGKPTIEVLKQSGVQNVLLHAFDGNWKAAMQGVQLGYYFSVPPSVVRSEQKQKLVEKVPLDNLLLETDSPALGPAKQERNVPANIRVSCEYIAKIKGISIDTVMEVTTTNALKLFPKLKGLIIL